MFLCSNTPCSAVQLWIISLDNCVYALSFYNVAAVRRKPALFKNWIYKIRDQDVRLNQNGYQESQCHIIETPRTSYVSHSIFSHAPSVSFTIQLTFQCTAGTWCCFSSRVWCLYLMLLFSMSTHLGMLDRPITGLHSHYGTEDNNIEKLKYYVNSSFFKK